MAKKPKPEKVSANLTETQVRAAIPKIKRRFDELSQLEVDKLDNQSGPHILDALAQKINATLREVFGPDTIEYEEYSVETFKPVFGIWFDGMDDTLRGNLDEVRNKVRGGISKIQALLETLQEQAGVDEGETSARSIRAYGGLDLHPEIARAASKLYKDGHYANAVEASVKALNGLVRLRSGLEYDGTTLMERAFSPANPVLKFNNLLDQSDKDEQKGFMQLFSGAVSGLRNPRAHGFIQDDPERALEFIAFVSLLAKLLDGATT